jgi:hypothetical protein
MVGMVLLSIFLAMFTGAVLMMNNAMTKSQAVSLTASQLNVAFLAMDSTVRDAAFISTPRKGKTTGDWYVELRGADAGTEVCTQLRVDIATQQLQRRSWTVVKAVASAPTAWVPISSGISNGGASAGTAGQPFALVPPRANEVFQQLRITLVSPAGSGSSLTTSTSSFTLTALNSVIPAPTAPICQQQGWP